MVTFANAGLWARQCTDNAYQARFLTTYGPATFAAGNIQLYLPPQLLEGGRTQAVIVDIIGLHTVNVAPVKFLVNQLFAVDPQYIYLESVTTPARYGDHVWEPRVPISIDTGAMLLNINTEDQGAADTAYFWVMGTYEWDPLDKHGTEPVLQPVSLEGYKWPLSRR